ncbi:hypothetical protein RF11_11652 [Thelohanellus kitauei]|uniref:Uncharacterized protein n=1 Tax=Thelohanellus kitauei TaxID=669202 RepID=A0A0C2J261_THEKT|nr:hypothetical protein RF11_11652 [Thelohanellus kitauei]
MDSAIDQNISSSASRVGRSDEPKILFTIPLESLIESNELCHVICINSGIVEALSGGGRKVHEDSKNIKDYFKTIGIVPYDLHLVVLNCNDPILTPCIEEHKVTYLPSRRSYPRLKIGLILIICVLGLLLAGHGVKRLHSYLLSRLQKNPSSTGNLGNPFQLFSENSNDI